MNLKKLIYNLVPTEKVRIWSERKKEVKPDKTLGRIVEAVCLKAIEFGPKYAKAVKRHSEYCELQEELKKKYPYEAARCQANQADSFTQWLQYMGEEMPELKPRFFELKTKDEYRISQENVFRLYKHSIVSDCNDGHMQIEERLLYHDFFEECVTIGLNQNILTDTLYNRTDFDDKKGKYQAVGAVTGATFGILTTWDPFIAISGLFLGGIAADGLFVYGPTIKVRSRLRKALKERRKEASEAITRCNR